MEICAHDKHCRKFSMMYQSIVGSIVSITAVSALLWHLRERRRRAETKNIGKISKLFIYPIKSCAGIQVTTAFVEPRGLQHDRRWMVVDKKNVFLSQRRCPKMALLIPQIVNIGTLRLKHVKAGEIDVPLVPYASKTDPQYCERIVEVWSSVVSGAVDQGDDVAAWLCKTLDMEGLRLVYMPDNCMRSVKPKYGKGNVSFADSLPFLLASEASLELLNQKMIESDPKNKRVGFDRFRPNIVVEGDFPPFQEDKFVKLSTTTNKITFRNMKPCDRCTVPNIDQKTGKLIGVSSEPTKTLRTFRQRDGEVYFGVNLMLETQQFEAFPTLSVGDDLLEHW